jgi:acyl-CoA synthetase (AMP-forming)/AMP-acid ligase II
LLRRSIQTFKCRFLQVYGLTETTGPFTALSHEQHVGERLLSCGRPMLGGRVRIVDSNGNNLPPHEVGEILYQGENLMAGYWARADATAQAIRGGWFHTGDAGYVDEEGFIFLKDRIKDMIVTGSGNVYPAEIEAVLMGHPEVLECAVIVCRTRNGARRSKRWWSAAGGRLERNFADRMEPRQARRVQTAALGRLCRCVAAQRQRQAS